MSKKGNSLFFNKVIGFIKELSSSVNFFERNNKIADVEKNATKPSDAINSALDNFWEKQDGSNDPSKQKELLQL